MSFGMKNDAGQDGTLSPESVVVTCPPMKIRRKVRTTSIAERALMDAEPRSALSAAGGKPASLRRRQLPVLREVVLSDFGRRVLVRAAVYGRDPREVAVRRRSRRLPLERVRVPWVVARWRALEHAPQEVDHEHDLGRA